MQRFRALEPLPADQFMAGFVQLQLAPGVEPPPPPEGPPPPWMAKRPAGVRAFIDACVISFNIGRGSGVQRPSGCVASSSAPESAARICWSVDIIWPADS